MPGTGWWGDQTYGGRRKLSHKAFSEAAREAVAAFPRQALHAAVLGFVHPVSGENIRFEADFACRYGGSFDAGAGRARLNVIRHVGAPERTLRRCNTRPL